VVVHLIQSAIIAIHHILLDSIHRKPNRMY